MTSEPAVPEPVLLAAYYGAALLHVTRDGACVHCGQRDPSCWVGDVATAELVRGSLTHPVAARAVGKAGDHVAAGYRRCLFRDPGMASGVGGMPCDMNELWDLWLPHVGATGLSFARSRIDPEVAGERLLVHAAPSVLDVTVRGEDGTVRAEGRDLKRAAPGPMSFLVRRGDRITLEDGWPSDEDLGRLVILPGGEAGILRAWWHADDRSAWRWQVEFSNHV